MDESSRPDLERAAAAARESGLDRDARKLIPWAYDVLGDGLMMSTAFGKSGMCILHIVSELELPIPIYFIDTGFHFEETMRFVDTLRDRWRLNLLVERPELYGIDFIRRHGEKLYETDPDFCCQKNKVEPFSNLIKRYDGWITGVRRDQSSTRAMAETIEILEGGKLKVQPLAYWTLMDVNAYVTENKIPLHPLFSRGYTSIGCAPCTQPNSDPADERAGRWSGKAKTECGLHTYWKKKKQAVEEAMAEKTPDAGAPAIDAPSIDVPSIEIPSGAPTNGTNGTGGTGRKPRTKPEEKATRSSKPWAAKKQ